MSKCQKPRVYSVVLMNDCLKISSQLERDIMIQGIVVVNNNNNSKMQ